MALYAALMQQIYPDREVETWIVWSEAAAVEIIGPDLRSAALEAITGDGPP